MQYSIRRTFYVTTQITRHKQSQTLIDKLSAVGVHWSCYAAIAIVDSPFLKLVKRYPKSLVHYDKASSDKFSSS